ncbi:MAG: hypothetical protein MSB08_01015, partial [Subdoligranulum sp.]|nr:hypothetical protein [Subdoligranulum sp.]
QAACGGFDDHHHSRHKRQLEHHMENLTGGTPPVRYLPCVVPCKLYFIAVNIESGFFFLFAPAF